MECSNSTELSLGPLRARKNRMRMRSSTELFLGPFVPRENSDDCFFLGALKRCTFIPSAYNSHQSFVQLPFLCAVIRLLCIYHAFYAVTRRRSSPGQGVSGLSLSRRNEGLKVGSR